MAALPSFIPLHDAAKKLGVTEARLRSLIDAGRMKAAEINGEIVVSEDSLPKRKEDLPEYTQFNELKQKSIGVGEASRKYKIPNSTLYGWVENGIITRLGRDGQKVLIDEQDVAYCAQIYHLRSGQGKWLFNLDGTPYKPKRESFIG